MRVAYEIVQRLMWDAAFRRDFIQDRRCALAQHYPSYRDEGIFGDRALVAGLEEEAYRRIAFFQRTSKEVFPCGHHLLLAHYGHEFFEDLLKGVFSRHNEKGLANTALDILEPFDGYIAGPLILDLAEQLIHPDRCWLRDLLRFEWAKWHARRVANGWPPLESYPPLVPGASLVHSDFDLKSVIKESIRLEACSVATEVYRWRIQPGSGSYYAAVFPKDGNVFEAKLDRESYVALAAAVADNTSHLTDDLRSTVKSIGLILDTSFLCCSKEVALTNELTKRIPALVEPEPH